MTPASSPQESETHSPAPADLIELDIAAVDEVLAVTEAAATAPLMGLPPMTLPAYSQPSSFQTQAFHQPAHKPDYFM